VSSTKVISNKIKGTLLEFTTTKMVIITMANGRMIAGLGVAVFSSVTVVS
jgi:hypothetical protein